MTFVFFAGILAGHLGLSIDPQMLVLAQNFGLILFVYSLGLQVGPSFFPSLKKGGMKLNLLAEEEFDKAVRPENMTGPIQK